MDALNYLINTPPLKDKLVVGDYKSCTVNWATQIVGGAKKVLIVAREKDYLFLGKTLRDTFIENDFDTQALVLEDLSIQNSKVYELFSGYDLIVGVSESDYLKNLCALCNILGFPLILIPTSIIFADLFFDGFKTQFCLNKGDCFKVVLDIDVLKKLTKNQLADGFSFCAFLIGAYHEVQIYNIIKGKKVQKSQYFLDAYKTLNYITKENIIGCLLVAQLNLAIAFLGEVNPYVLGLMCAGETLSKMCNAPVYECVFGLIAPLFTLFKCYLGMDKCLVLLQNTNKDVTHLSEIFNVSELEIYQNLNLLNVEEITTQKSDICNNQNAIELIDKAIIKNKKLKGLYDVVYKGRHVRASFTKSQQMTALKLGFMMSKGLSKLIYDDGVFEILQQI